MQPDLDVRDCERFTSKVKKRYHELKKHATADGAFVTRHPEVGRLPTSIGQKSGFPPTPAKLNAARPSGFCCQID
jgi:hypothetical protein